ncbi:hypothetical protein B484DRAFT_456520 [Ochromonadaceae sp. CCMP2298]|nr:hypothetical protein B484DRAFT_456520 [Ochromonadaceae sp. CCMP2298]|mmetsp:Transcript_11235/g.24977  ORF Transcript_11235/g.24977 Transcript_11235/m.24977 type:complete len:282 (+) Transcript_11235:146-991(+)
MYVCVSARVCVYVCVSVCLVCGGAAGLHPIDARVLLRIQLVLGAPHLRLRKLSPSIRTRTRTSARASTFICVWSCSCARGVGAVFRRHRACSSLLCGWVRVHSALAEIATKEQAQQYHRHHRDATQHHHHVDTTATTTATARSRAGRCGGSACPLNQRVHQGREAGAGQGLQGQARAHIGGKRRLQRCEQAAAGLAGHERAHSGVVCGVCIIGLVVQQQANHVRKVHARGQSSAAPIPLGLGAGAEAPALLVAGHEAAEAVSRETQLARHRAQEVGAVVGV